MPVLLLLAPLLVSAANDCYLVTNTQIEIIPCNFDPEVIAARTAELEGSARDGGGATPAPPGTTPRVQARERPQGDEPHARGRERPDPARDGAEPQPQPSGAAATGR